MKKLLILLGVFISLGSLLEIATLSNPDFFPAEIRESKSVILHHEIVFVYYWTLLLNVSFLICASLLVYSGLLIKKNVAKGFNIGFRVSITMIILTTLGALVTVIFVLPVMLSEFKGQPSIMVISLMGAALAMPVMFGVLSFMLKSRGKIAN